MVKLNTELKLAVLVQLAQTETNKFIVTASTRRHRTAPVPQNALFNSGDVPTDTGTATFTPWFGPA